MCGKPKSRLLNRKMFTEYRILNEKPNLTILNQYLTSADSLHDSSLIKNGYQITGIHWNDFPL